MTSLIIQIPCLDEEATLPRTLADLPREVPGFDRVEWLVVDDGSRDRTVDVARAHGVEHVVRLPAHRGLATAFQAGLDAALKLGADVIVNTDADNQYRGTDVERLVAPILAGRADVVVGDREVRTSAHFSARKRGLSRLGSWLVRRLSYTGVADAASGFRALNREAAIQTHVVSTYTYTLESLIAAGRAPVVVEHVPVRTNPDTRPSRLFPSLWTYVRRNGLSIFRIYAQHEPLRVFVVAALLVALAGVGLAFASLIAAAVLIGTSVLLVGFGVIGDLLYAQRVLTQRTLERARRIELALGVPPSHHETGSGNGRPVRPLAHEPSPAKKKN
jgi:glycosyltransferase involved in cell wall biosynthesis